MACGKNPFAKMNKRVTLQTVTQGVDGQGGWSETWSNLATVAASIEPVKGWERFQAGQTMTPVTYKVTVRYNSRITTAKRLLYGTRVFEIKEALNLNEDNAIIEMKCMELA